MPHITPNLELQEDKMFSELADQRIATTKKWVSHKDAWNIADIKELRENILEPTKNCFKSKELFIKNI